MLYQTKRVKDAMVAAGFDRKKVSVTTEFDPGVGSYKSPVITVKDMTRLEMYALIDAALENGISVTVCRHGNNNEGLSDFGYPHFSDSCHDRGTLSICNFSKSWEDGRWQDAPSWAYVISHYRVM